MDNLQWETIEYTKEDGVVPVYEFLDTLPTKKANKVTEDIEKLERFGPRWGMPHVDHIEENIYELRTKHGSDIFRTFFFIWHHTVLVLTNGYYKKGQKMDPREFKRAKSYRDDWIERHGKGV
ncbi:type II toxin-antitoxin system RelE/ParE family toxin [Alkalihalobacterium elongatum]|uniref:type II toxin-antitoxin system RelE/ParE family toxin n=1 Tax=Alkalihalobacterium elongatum TaxID=2675466 RepID=UPI001C1F78B0|nr:type II toxin-antitoxin system RelE/ParE family toxin [Alkalihalobacterium elongatum]